MVQYDPGIIQQFADALYAHAQRIELIYTVLGAAIGCAGGIAVSSGNKWQPVIVIAASALLGFGGYLIGHGKAFALRLSAQVALCQVQIEKNTRVHMPQTEA